MKSKNQSKQFRKNTPRKIRKIKESIPVDSLTFKNWAQNVAIDNPKLTSSELANLVKNNF